MLRRPFLLAGRIALVARGTRLRHRAISSLHSQRSRPL